MAEDKKLENKIDLEATVIEQIADMQLMYLRQNALNRVLSYEEIKTLETLAKVKNTEVEKRQPKEEPDQKKLRAQKLKELANTASVPLIETPKVENSERTNTVSES